MHARRCIALVMVLALWLVGTVGAQGVEGEVLVLTARGPVTPALGSYLERGLREAEARNAALLVLRLDTPGGSVEVMGQLVRDLSNARVPTLVYVWPSGGRAASAGTFLALSADLAAMAPQTTIGAASVVDGGGGEIDETLQRKITNDLVAAIRSQTERRGPEAVAWAERAITDAVVADANEALEIGIIDFVARDVTSLLEQADGATVTLASGDEITLTLAQSQVREMPMGWLERLLHVITDPNIALLLLSLGSLAIFYEIASPGGYIGGIFGVIAMLLGFYALGSLDANWAGLGLLVFAFALLAIEIKAASHGLFAAGGLIAFVFGSLLLFQTSYRPVSLSVIGGLTLLMGAFFVFVLAAVFRSRRLRPLTGKEGMVGAIGQVRTTVGPHEPGMVFVDGALWQAYAPKPLPPGSHVRITTLRGLRLEVEPVLEEEQVGG